jgi:formiminotetrahydrofolate cyclodeaminase
MKDLTLVQFLDRLASSDPTPGGGAAAAMAGATAAGLVAMVARLSTGKGGDDAVWARVVTFADAERAMMVDLATKDVQAFDAVMQAMHLPRGTEEATQRRQTALQHALKGAADVPLDVASRAVMLLERCTELTRTGNPNVISDVGVAVVLAHAAVHGALLNVRINLRGIKDPAYRGQATERVRTLGQRADIVREEALVEIDRRLSARREPPPPRSGPA